MRPFARIALAGLCLGALVTETAVAPAFARDDWHRSGARPSGGRPPAAYARGGGGYRRGHGGSNVGAAVAAGIAGLAAGAIIAGSAPRRGYVYEEPAPAYGLPAGAAYVDDDYGAPPPWTPDWYAWCAQRYRSFDPRSGTYLAYDGRRYMCQ